MAKSKKKSKVKRLVGSVAMDVLKDNVSPGRAPAVQSVDSMDTAEIVITDDPALGSKILGTAGGGIRKKGPEKRKAVKLRKQKAILKAISLIEKQERRVTRAELKEYGKQELKKMD